MRFETRAIWAASTAPVSDVHPREAGQAMDTTQTLAEAEQGTGLAASRSGTRVAAIAVIAAAVMAPFGAIMSGWADQATWLDSASAVVAFYHRSGYQGRVTGTLLIGLAFLLLLIFVAKLADVISTADPPSAWHGRLILAIAGVDAALVLVAVAAFSAAIWRGAHGGASEEGFVMMNDIQFAFGWLSLLASAVLAFAIGSAILRGGLVPLWLGWVILADGVLFLFGEFSPLVVWDVAYGLFLGLLVVMGVLLVTGRHPEAPSAVGRSPI